MMKTDIFLSHYNRNSYEIALANLPEINSQFKIKNIEVWLTEDAQNSRETELRDIVALNDLGVAEAELFDMGITSAARFCLVALFQKTSLEL